MSAATLTKPRPAVSARLEVRAAAVCGMDADTRAALARLEDLARTGPVAVAGEFMPDRGVSARLAALGVVQQVGPHDFLRFRHLVTPYSGIAPLDRKHWQESAIPLLDLSSPAVRRAQVALGLLRMEGAQALVIGRHGDPETMALAAAGGGARVIQDTTDTARLRWSPAFGAVCQTTLSPRLVRWLADQLAMRYRDARVTFLNTTVPAMAAREQALEPLVRWADAVVIVGRPGETSAQALAEAALRQDRPALVVQSAADLDRRALAGARRVALTAGNFATDAAMREVFQALR